MKKSQREMLVLVDGHTDWEGVLLWHLARGYKVVVGDANPAQFETARKLTESVGGRVLRDGWCLICYSADRFIRKGSSPSTVPKL
jgi:hypothetical protein